MFPISCRVNGSRACCNSPTDLPPAGTLGIGALVRTSGLDMRAASRVPGSQAPRDTEPGPRRTGSQSTRGRAATHHGLASVTPPRGRMEGRQRLRERHRRTQSSHHHPPPSDHLPPFPVSLPPSSLAALTHPTRHHASDRIQRNIDCSVSALLRVRGPRRTTRLPTNHAALQTTSSPPPLRLHSFPCRSSAAPKRLQRNISAPIVGTQVRAHACTMYACAHFAR